MPDRPSTVAAFLEAHPLPWRAAEVHALTGAEWDVLDATGHPVPNHGGVHFVREWAMVFAEMGNEVGRLRGLVEEAFREGWIDGTWDGGEKPGGLTATDRWEQSEARRALDTAAPAAQTPEATDE